MKNMNFALGALINQPTRVLVIGFDFIPVWLRYPKSGIAIYDESVHNTRYFGRTGIEPYRMINTRVLYF